MGPLYNRVLAITGFNMMPSLIYCHVLTLVPLFVFVFVWSGRELGGAVYVRFSMICYFCVWPGMVLNQRQLSLIEKHI